MKSKSFRAALFGAAALLALPLAAFPVDNRVNPDGTPVLIPAVQQYKPGEGKLALPAEFTVSAPAEAANEVEVLGKFVKQYFPYRPYSQVEKNAFCRLELTRDNVPPQPEGYTLAIDDDGIAIRARDVRGLYYGVQTLHNLLRNAVKPELPRCSITDWPVLRDRGIYFDWRIRGYRGTKDQLVREIDGLGALKYNILMVEFSDTFPYRDNPFTKRRNSFTTEDMEAVRDAARRNHIEIIPFLQIISHDNWLQSHPRYWEDIAEGKPWKAWSSASCPRRPLPRQLNKMAIREQIEFFKPRRFMIALDEVDQCPWASCKECRKHSGHDLLRDATVEYTEEVLKYGVTPIISHDQFFPGAPLKGADILPLLDKRVNICNWDYSEFMRATRWKFLKSTGLALSGMSFSNSPNNLKRLPQELVKQNIDGNYVTFWGSLRNPANDPPGSTNTGRAGYTNGGNYNWNPEAPAPAAQTFDAAVETMRLIAPEKLITSPSLVYAPIPIDDAFNTRLGADPFFPMLDRATAAKVSKELAAAPEKFRFAAEADGTYFAVVAGTGAQEAKSVTIPVGGVRAEVFSLLCAASVPRNPSAGTLRQHIGSLVFRYEDGTSAAVKMQRQVVIMEWNSTASIGFNTRFVDRFNDKRGALAGLFAHDWRNPFPQKPVKEIVWSAAEQDYGFSVALFAVSAANRGKAPLVTAAAGKVSPADRIPKATPPPATAEKVSINSPDSVVILDYENGLPKGTHVTYSGIPESGKFVWKIVPGKGNPTRGAKVLEMTVPPVKPGMALWPRLTVDVPVNGKLLAEKKVRSLFFEANVGDVSMTRICSAYLFRNGAGAKAWITFNRPDNGWHRFAIPIDEMGSETGGVPLDQVTTFRFSIFFTPLLETTTVRLGPVGLSPRVVKNPQTLRIEKVPEDPKEPVPLFSHVIDL